MIGTEENRIQLTYVPFSFDTKKARCLSEPRFLPDYESRYPFPKKTDTFSARPLKYQSECPRPLALGVQFRCQYQLEWNKPCFEGFRDCSPHIPRLKPDWQNSYPSPKRDDLRPRPN